MKRCTLDQRSAEIARKVAAGAALPPAAVLRRAGDSRTESKRALLETLRRVAAAQGRKEPLSSD